MREGSVPPDAAERLLELVVPVVSSARATLSRGRWLQSLPPSVLSQPLDAERSCSPPEEL